MDISLLKNKFLYYLDTLRRNMVIKMTWRQVADNLI